MGGSTSRQRRRRDSGSYAVVVVPYLLHRQHCHCHREQAMGGRTRWRRAWGDNDDDNMVAVLRHLPRRWHRWHRHRHRRCCVANGSGGTDEVEGRMGEGDNEEEDDMVAVLPRPPRHPRRRRAGLAQLEMDGAGEQTRWAQME